MSVSQPSPRSEQEKNRADTVRVVHLTSAHQANDVRIFRKEVRSAIAAGFKVTLVGTGSPSADLEGVRYLEVARLKGRVARMTLTALRVWRAALSSGADVYHFHDPELLPGGLILALLGYRVVYDAHEDLAASLRDRDYLPGLRGRLIAMMLGSFELAVSRRLAAVVAATPSIARRHRAARHVITVANFPLAEEYAEPDAMSYEMRPRHLVYVGLISIGRGVREMLDTLELLRDERVRLQLAGSFDSPGLEEEIRSHAAWDLVDFHGVVSPLRVRSLLGAARIGLVLFLPRPNHIEAQPNKLFEYMAAGVPLVASDFPLWREIVSDSGVGVLVNPEVPDRIAAAIRQLLADERAAAEMGAKGRMVVQEKYNWDHEAATLMACYKELMRS